MFNTDTIVSIATPAGIGAVGIIRISGSQAFSIADQIYKGKFKFKEYVSHSIHYGFIVDPSTETHIDEVLISKMKAPKTFTREDIVEINCHGGNIILRKIFELICSLGARPAEPGEFTKRAFLNGRIDLSQAEAVMDVVQAKSQESHKAAMEQLEGNLAKGIRNLRHKIIELLAHMEVTFDYPDHDIEEITAKQVYEGILEIDPILKNISDSYHSGRILREGLKVVIIGQPNVGKSSLLNLLSGSERAIVTEIPGTTRDIIEEYIDILGIPVKILDTAGIRATEDVVEKIGVDRARKEMGQADFIILMLDATRKLEQQDIQLLQQCEKSKSVILINKIDIGNLVHALEIQNQLKEYKVLSISVKENQGTDQLKQLIRNEYDQGITQMNQEVLLTNLRHKNLVEEARNSLASAKIGLENGLPLDLISIDIKNSAEHLGNITGDIVLEDVMTEIFSRFCLGK